MISDIHSDLLKKDEEQFLDKIYLGNIKKLVCANLKSTRAVHQEGRGDAW